MPALQERETAYAAQLQEMRAIACCMIVPEKVLDALSDIRGALKAHKESKKALENALKQQKGV